MGVTALSLGQTTLWFDDRAEACWTKVHRSLTGPCLGSTFRRAFRAALTLKTRPA